MEFMETKLNCFSRERRKIQVTDIVWSLRAVLWSARDGSVPSSIFRCKKATPSICFLSLVLIFVIIIQLLINNLAFLILFPGASFSPSLYPVYLTNFYSSFKMSSFKKIPSSVISLFLYTEL